MTQTVITPPMLTQVALRLSPRAAYFLVLAALCLAAGLYLPFPQPMATLVLLAAGTAFLFVALMVRSIAWGYVRRRNRGFKALSAVVSDDPAAVMATDADGMVLFQNPAAIERFGDRLGQGLDGLLRGMFAAPQQNILRLQGKALATGCARADVQHLRDHLRLTAHRSGDGTLWRFDAMGDRPSAPKSPQISLPMMTVSRAGTILFMNDAARAFLGSRETTLERVFGSDAQEIGGVMQVLAHDGPRPAMVSQVQLSAGRREIYLLPPPPAPKISHDEWTIIDELPVPLIKIDRDGRITMANRRARFQLGDEAVFGSSFADQVEGLGRPVSEWLREAHTGRHLGKTEILRPIHRDDDVFLQVSLEQVNDDDGSALVAVLQDATELKSLEAQFVQSQKMEAIGQLAGGVAHDFNNLLTAISGHCDLLLMGRDESDPEFSDLSQIHQNANRAAALVRQLLGFSRKQTLRPEPLDLRDSLADLMHLLNRLVGEKVTLTLDHDPDLSLIRADRRQLDQVLMNLVVNARDAMPDGGDIRVETRNDSLIETLKRDRAAVPYGEYVRIRVIDQGTGIAPDKLTKIFEPFFTTKRAGKGTGLGLSMAYGIVKQMGGYIFVDSELGAGTVFTIYFPVLREEEEALTQEQEAASSEMGVLRLEDPLPVEAVDGAVQPAMSWEEDDAHAVEATLMALQNDQRPPDEPTDLVHQVQDPPHHEVEPLSCEAEASAVVELAPEAPARPNGSLPIAAEQPKGDNDGIVLLVEDEAPVRAFAARALRMRGYTVLEAENAEEALTTVKDASLDIDVFVTDVIMPGMDGPTWVARALEDRPGVKVVFMSGYAEDSVADHQARIPNSVFLPKPFSLTDLTATVQEQMH